MDVQGIQRYAGTFRNMEGQLGDVGEYKKNTGEYRGIQPSSFKVIFGKLKKVPIYVKLGYLRYSKVE
jgi:hypothetical protein